MGRLTSKERYWGNEEFREQQKAYHAQRYQEMKAKDPEGMREAQLEKRKHAKKAAKVSREDLALEFNKRYGTDLKKRIAKLKEEMEELTSAEMLWEASMNQSNVSDRMRAYYAMREEMRDVASIVNQLEHLMLKSTWPKEVHQLLAERDKDPDFGRRHEHVRNVAAGE